MTDNFCKTLHTLSLTHTYTHTHLLLPAVIDPSFSAVLPQLEPPCAPTHAHTQFNANSVSPLVIEGTSGRAAIDGAAVCLQDEILLTWFEKK